MPANEYIYELVYVAMSGQGRGHSPERRRIGDRQDLICMKERKWISLKKNSKASPVTA
jgi:hypothetical protein